MVERLWPLEDAGPGALALEPALRRRVCPASSGCRRANMRAGGALNRRALSPSPAPTASSSAHKSMKTFTGVNKPHIMLPELFDIWIALKCERLPLCPDSHAPRALTVSWLEGCFSFPSVHYKHYPLGVGGQRFSYTTRKEQFVHGRQVNGSLILLHHTWSLCEDSAEASFPTHGLTGGSACQQ